MKTEILNSISQFAKSDFESGDLKIFFDENMNLKNPLDVIQMAIGLYNNRDEEQIKRDIKYGIKEEEYIDCYFNALDMIKFNILK